MTAPDPLYDIVVLPQEKDENEPDWDNLPTRAVMMRSAFDPDAAHGHSAVEVVAGLTWAAGVMARVASELAWGLSCRCREADHCRQNEGWACGDLYVDGDPGPFAVAAFKDPREKWWHPHPPFIEVNVPTNEEARFVQYVRDRLSGLLKRDQDARDEAATMTAKAAYRAARHGITSPSEQQPTYDGADTP